MVTIIDGKFTVKKLRLRPGIRLLMMDLSVFPIVLRSKEELEIFGVVTFIICVGA